MTTIEVVMLTTTAAALLREHLLTPMGRVDKAIQIGWTTTPRKSSVV